MNLQQAAFRDYPNVFFISLTALAAPLALRPDSSILPVVAILSALLIYAPILFRRDAEHQAVKTTLLAAALTVGSAAFRLGASLDALSTPGGSIAALFGISAALSSLAIAAIFTATRLSPRLASPSSRVTLFPAIWATLWATVSYINPVGHLATWSVANNADAYNWIAPYVGPVGKDWIIAAWAVVISETITQWFMEPRDGESAPLLTTSPNRPNRSNEKPTKILGFVLALLLVPSIVPSNLPLPVSDIDAYTPISVGCVLPPFQRYKKHVLGLDDYIKESNKIRAMARVILWPEGAVAFDSAEARETAFALVREKLPGVYVGVSFEETITDPDDPTGRKHMTRTGIAVVSQYSNETQHIYYKRHLVPGGESYRLRHSTEQPSLFEAQLPKPGDIPPTKWDPSEKHTRPLLLTSSICLDFATPSPFSSLPARPALILAPARTWDRTVGNAMWLEAKQRAAEVGSMVLWCDGGDGGVSGVAGGGFDEVTQVGAGSFVRTIAIPHPFDSKRTVYARFGNLGLIFVWIFVWIFVVGIPRGSIGAAVRFVREKRERIRGPSVPEGNLLGDCA